MKAMRPSACAVIVCMLALGTIEGSAVARPASARAKALAKKHNARARSLFHLGRFEDAAKEYEKAYRAAPVPEFLHNLGRCHERLEGAEHAERALFYFESYLKAAPDTPNRADVDAAVARLRARVEKLEARPPTAPPPAPAPRPETALATPSSPPRPPDLRVPAPDSPRATGGSTPIYKRWWLWTLIGVVVAGAATTTAVMMTRPGEAAPVMGTMPPGQVQLELRGGR